MVALNRITICILISFIAVCTLQTGCSYYQVKNITVNQSELKKARDDKMCFILHHNNSVWHLENIHFIDSTNVLSGRIFPLTKNHESFKNTKYHWGGRIKLKTGNPIHEFHVYTSEYIDDGEGQIMVPITAIKNIELYDVNLGRSISNFAVPFGVFFLLPISILIWMDSWN